MNIDRRILIQQYDVGYVVTDYTSNRKYAKETAEGVIEVLRAIFSAEKLDQKQHDVLHDVIPDTTHETLHGISTSPAGKQEQAEPDIQTVGAPAPKIEEPLPVQSDPLSQVVAAQEPVVIAKHAPEKPTALQKIKELAQIKDPDGLFIPKFEYDLAQKKEIEGYSNISVVELLDGRAMIQYKGAHYYTTKEKVMQQIPYPTPYSYFKKKRIGVSSTAQTCLRAYRHYLANLLSADKSLTKNDNEKVSTLPYKYSDEVYKKCKNKGLTRYREFCTPDNKFEQNEIIGDEQGTCDDITFDACANNSPEKCKLCVNESRFENKNKLAANKPAPPLMRASVPP